MLHYMYIYIYIRMDPLDTLEELLLKRKWVKSCLRSNVAQPERDRKGSEDLLERPEQQREREREGARAARCHQERCPRVVG